MFDSVSLSELKKNRLLSVLPARQRYDFRPHFEVVKLSEGQNLDDEGGTASDFAYFPLDSIISLTSTMEDAQDIEVAMVGREGLSGIHRALGFETSWYQPVVQVSGAALRIESAVLREQFAQNPAFSLLLMQYLHALYAQIAQVAICYRRHKIQQRLQTWLMMMFNRIAGDELNLKQDEIANTLGYQRPTVSLATAALQQQEIIRYSRGRIKLIDREQLEQGACECYQIMEAQYERISAPPVIASSPLPTGVTADNLGESARTYIEQLGYAIDRVREICAMTDAVHKRQEQIISGRKQ